MKKSLLIGLPALLLATVSCVDSLTDYNVDPKAPAQVPGVTLVSTAERALARVVTSSNVNNNPFRLYVQYWAQTTYFDESIYDIKTRQIDRNFWNRLYVGGGTADPTIEGTGALRNLSEAKSLISADPLLAPKVKANQLAAIEVLSVYAWSTLVNTYGNIPYSEALDGNKPQPKYDDAKAIYTDLFTRLDAAIASLDVSAEGLGDADLIYHGDVAEWKKFANSLKLRMALTVADEPAFTAKASTAAQQAASNVFTSNEESATFDFISSPPNAHPVWEDLIQSGRKDYIGTNFFIDRLTTLNDPRLPVYFKPVGTTSNYIGGSYGRGNVAANFSNPGRAVENPAQPGVLLSYSEVEFLLAEAVERNIMVGGTAEGHYNAAVTASIEEWGGSSSQAMAYLAQPTVSYSTATGTFKEKIGVQKWIALYNQPVQAWTEWRRLDFPRLTAPAGALSAIPLRLTYPTAEGNVNGANYKAASAAIGGDEVTTKIFWDKF